MNDSAELIRQNIELCVGLNIEEPVIFKSGIAVYSDELTEIYDNCVLIEDFHADELPEMRKLYDDKGKNFALSVTEYSLPVGVKETIEGLGFTPEAHNAYMTLAGEFRYQNPNVEVKTVLDRTEKDHYLAIFKEVFCDGDGPYGGTPYNYLEAIEKYFQNYPENSRKDYVAYIAGKPVGTATYLFNENYILLTGLAVLPEFRNQGVAKTLISKGFNELKGDRVYFLATAAGSVDEEIYKKLGFKTEIIEDMYSEVK